MRRLLFVIAACAGLLGAAGIGAAAASAHIGGGTLLETAATFLLIHSAATFGVVALALRAPASTTIFAVAALALILGMSLFCGDFATRALASHALFPMAAPIGGIILIGGWLMAAVAAGTAAIGRD
ncbi:MAG: hypothetical protein NVSMB26_10750 [Beijerinckiaceae bacterium]